MKNKITYETNVRIKVSEYREDITWGHLLNASNSLSPNDVIVNIGWNEEKVSASGFGSYEPEDGESYQQVLNLTVRRVREETDEEYVERLKREESEKKRKEINEYQTYLRLRGKYEK